MADDAIPSPQSKAELMDLIAASRAALERAIDVPDEAMLTAPGPEGWSVKDHLIHIALWEDNLLALLQGRNRQAAMGLSSEDDNPEASAEDINDVLYVRHKDRPLPDVLHAFTAAHERVLAQLDAMSWEDLGKPYSDYQPNDPPPNPDPVGYWVAGNTYGHFDEHREWIAAILASLGKTAAGTPTPL